MRIRGMAEGIARQPRLTREAGKHGDLAVGGDPAARYAADHRQDSLM
jgi:hypothetical protein